jgi:hypothetical protein
MKKAFVLTLVLFIFGGFAAIAQPKLEIEGGNTYDWGTVNQGDSPLKAKVKLYNKGTDTLHITRVKPACGCTTAPLDNDHIAPGDFATLDITLRVSSYSGHVGKNISISSNDPNNSNINYSIKANVFTPITVNPKYIRMYNVATEEESSSSVNLVNNTKKDITIKKVDTKLDGLTLDLNEDTVIPAGKSIKVNAKYTPEKDGPFYGSLKFTTDSEEAPYIDISIRGSAKAPKSEADKSKPDSK